MHKQVEFASVFLAFRECSLAKGIFPDDVERMNNDQSSPMSEI